MITLDIKLSTKVGQILFPNQVVNTNYFLQTLMNINLRN